MGATTKYSKLMLAAINGDKPAEELSHGTLYTLLKIAQANGDTEIIERIRPVYQRKIDERRERQNTKSLERYGSYSDKNTHEQTGPYIPQSQRFSDIQQAIIDDIIPIDDVSTKDLGRLIEKARRLGCQDVVDRFEPIRATRKAEYKEVLRQRRRQEYLDKKNGIPVKKRKYTYHREGAPYISRKRPENNEYTDRQKAILRGEIPFEETHGNEYVAIERKARKKGDIEVLELVQTLAAEKRADKLERVREQAREYYRTHGYDPDRNYHKRKKLSRWEKAVLYGVIDLDDCDEDHLQHIVDVCTLTEDDLHKSLAEQLMQYKRNPKIVYKYHGTEALDIIGQLTFMPLPDPKHLTFKRSDSEESDDTFEVEDEDDPDHPIIDD